MSVNISVSESGPISLDDLLKSTFRIHRSGCTSNSTFTEDTPDCHSRSSVVTRSAGVKRKAKFDTDDSSSGASEANDVQSDEDHLVQTAQVLGTRTLRTIADISPGSMYVSAPDVKRRQSYTLIFKRECVRRMRHGGISINQMSRETGIDRRCLRSWLKQEAQLGEESQVECTRKRVSGAGRKIAYPQLETRLNEWYEAEIKAGHEVTYRKLSVFIYRLAKECGAPNPVKYSKEFFAKWQKKNNLVCKRKGSDIATPSSSEEIGPCSSGNAQKSLMDMLFEGVEESVLAHLGGEEGLPEDAAVNIAGYSPLASLILNQRLLRPSSSYEHEAEISKPDLQRNDVSNRSNKEESTSKNLSNEEEDEAEVQSDEPPALSPYSSDDDCGAETPPQLLAEGDPSKVTTSLSEAMCSTVGEEKCCTRKA